MNDALREAVRQEAGRETEPSAAIIDSQSVKTTEVKGRKRHIMVDVMGLLLAVVVHKASIQEPVPNCFSCEPYKKGSNAWS